MKENWGSEKLGKIGHQSVDSDEYSVMKKGRTRRNDEFYDKTDDIDLISELPELIIHHIFTFLHCTKDVVRISILSKKWKNLFNSYLVFDFDERWFRVEGEKGTHIKSSAIEVQKKKFKGYVEKSLALRLNPAPSIDKFRLCVTHSYDYQDMKRWIRVALEKNVKELEVNVITKDSIYLLPSYILCSASMTSLKLLGPISIVHDTHFKLSNLRELSLKGSILGQYMMGIFEESCPVLEDLRLVHCRDLFNLAILSFPKLKRVEVHECPNLIYIEIAAPNLETFWYHGRKHQTCKIDLKSSGNLKKLTLKDWKMTDAAFQDYISRCPLLETLVLNECRSLKQLNILSEKLKSLTLIQCSKFHAINIDAPNLYTFQYCGHRMPFPSMNVLRLREAEFSFNPIMKTSQCIVDLGKCLGNFDQYKGFKCIVQHSKQDMKIYGESSEAHLVPNDVRKLDMTFSSRSVVRIVDNWLRRCRGKNLVLVEPNGELIKLIHTVIMDRGDNRNCCGLYVHKCWRHFLARVEISKGKTCYEFKWRSKRLRTTEKSLT